MAKNDFQYAGWNSDTLQCGTIMTLILPGECTLQCGRWFWDDMPFNSSKRPPYWNSTSGFHETVGTANRLELSSAPGTLQFRPQPFGTVFQQLWDCLPAQFRSWKLSTPARRRIASERPFTNSLIIIIIIIIIIEKVKKNGEANVLELLLLLSLLLIFM